VRSFRTCARIRSLTTGTFNQVVKDRSTIRLSGAHSVQIESLCRALRRWADRSVRPTHRFRLSSKPYKHTAPRKVASTLTSHRISTGFPHWESEEPQGLKPGPLWEGFRGTTKVVPFPVLLRVRDGAFTARNGMAFRLAEHACSTHDFYAREDRRQKIEKRSYLEVLALKVPFRNRCFSTLGFRIQSRGRDD
jgi:hypothetical protein